MSKESILVVEDEKDVQNLLRYNLEKEGYEVFSALTGEEGFELAKSKMPDVIILDLMLPQIDGLEVCRLLKATKETKRIPILMLTAKSSEVDQVVGLELGASDYLTKPFSVKVLLARIKNALRIKAKPHEEVPVLDCCELALDKEKQLFKVKGKAMALTKTEFKIMSVLMERPKVVVSRDDLISMVWGSGSLVSSAAMNMQIMGLREKLGRYRDYVETIRGSGFRFC